MACIIALIIFGIMGIFSASHRALAKEAFSCVFNRVTLRPCNSDFKEKIKGRILSRLISKSTFLAKMVNKNYELLSWVFFILIIGSTFWMLKGVYNFYVYGSCNGLNESGFCAFDPRGENNKVTTIGDESESCGITQYIEDTVTLDGVDLSSFYTENIGSKDTIVFIGCYDCDYTRKAYPDILKLVEKKKTNYIFAHFPIKINTDFLSNIGYCVQKNYPDNFTDFNSYLFTENKDYILNPSNTNNILEKFNFNIDIINECSGSVETKAIVDNQISELNKTNLYGTPTIFINGKSFIGPKPYRVYRSAVNKFIFF